MTRKIKAAIKAKLIDLEAYVSLFPRFSIDIDYWRIALYWMCVFTQVDDELPDYIMVMVANKKTQAQMSSDLALFLG